MDYTTNFFERKFYMLYFAGFSWVHIWLDREQAARVVSGGMANVFHNAAKGSVTPYGPYRQFFLHIEPRARYLAQARNVNLPFGSWKTFPLPTVGELDDLARAYAGIHEAALLTSMTWTQLHDVGDAIRQYIPPRPARSQYRDWACESGRAQDLTREMLVSLQTHEEGSADACKLAGDVYAREKKRGELWLQHYREITGR